MNISESQLDSRAWRALEEDIVGRAHSKRLPADISGMKAFQQCRP